MAESSVDGVEDSQKMARLMLEPTLDINAAAPLLERLRELRDVNLTIDAGGVKHLGAQCLQVLLSAAVTWKKDGRIISYSALSDEFQEGLTILGANQAGIEVSAAS